MVLVQEWVVLFLDLRPRNKSLNEICFSLKPRKRADLETIYQKSDYTGICQGDKSSSERYTLPSAWHPAMLKAYLDF